MIENPPERPGAALALSALLGLAIALVAGWLATSLLRPPPTLPASAPADRFSAARAMRHVEVLAARPRPLGSEAHRQAADYLLEQLESLGLETQIHQAEVVRARRSGGLVGARVGNLLGRRRSGSDQPALLLVAHYDSRPQTPGAGDDASGVAAILESLRALGDDELNRDLIVLITDGEELGLLGARAFVDEHPWTQETGLVINVEARGNRGPAVMFETGGGSWRLLAALTRAVPRPLASSLSDEIYRRMPNDTDFSVFREAGLPGYNFALIEGLPAYHHASDRHDRLDPGSLQHMGESLLGLVRHLGKGELPAAEGADGVFFNLWGWRLFVYPVGWALPLAGGGLALAVMVLALARIRRLIRVRQLAESLVHLTMMTVLAFLLGVGAWRLLPQAAPRIVRGPHGLPHDGNFLFLALALLVSALLLGLLAGLRRRVGFLELGCGALLLWSLLALGSALLVPGASYLFTWPALAYLLGLGLVLALRWGREPDSWEVLLLAFATLPATVLFIPVLDLTHTALTVRMAGPLAALTALALTPLTPLLATVASRWPRVPVILCLMASVTLVGWVFVRSVPQPDRPWTDTASYLLDGDSGEARWISFDRWPDAWTGNLLPAESVASEKIEFLPDPDSPVRWAPARSLPLAPPEAEMLRDERRGGRRVEVAIRSPRGASLALIKAKAIVPIVAVSVAGERQELGEGSGGEVSLIWAGLPEEGLRVAFELTDTWPVEMTVVDLSYGFDQLGSLAPPPRPPGLIPALDWLTDSILVKKEFLF